MNIINQFRRKARIVEEVCDTRYLQAAQEAEYHVPQTDTDYPVYLTVKVQVKVAFVWVTVWAESCDITDGDTRSHIVKRANRLHRILEDKDFSVSATEVLPCSYYGEKFRIGFKDSSLIQTLKNINSLEVEFQAVDASRATTFSPATQPDSEEVTMLLMPMIIGD